MIAIGGIVSVGGSTSTGGGGSGIQTINAQAGPAIIVGGVNGATVITGANTVTVDVASLSGLIPQKFAAGFVSMTSGVFDHNFGTRDVVVSIYDVSLPPRAIIPDNIVLENFNQISVIFNRPQTGRIVIIG